MNEQDLAERKLQFNCKWRNNGTSSIAFYSSSIQSSVKVDDDDDQEVAGQYFSSICFSFC